MTDRERLARVIDPQAWKNHDNPPPCWSQGDLIINIRACEKSLQAADRILAKYDIKEKE